MPLKKLFSLSSLLAIIAVVAASPVSATSTPACEAPGGGINATVIKPIPAGSIVNWEAGKKIHLTVEVCTTVDVTIHVNAYQIPAAETQFLSKDFSLRAGKSKKFKYTFRVPVGASEVLYLFTATNLDVDNPYRYAQAVVDVIGT